MHLTAYYPMLMVDEIIPDQGNPLALLLQRIALIVRETEIEGCEWAACVIYSMWFFPLILDHSYLSHSPYSREVVSHIPGGNITALWVSGVLLFYQLGCCLLGGRPSFLVRKEEDLQPWYMLRIIGLIVSWLWFAYLTFLYFPGKLTGGTVLYCAGSLACFIGSHKVYKKMMREWFYRFFRQSSDYVREVEADMAKRHGEATR